MDFFYKEFVGLLELYVNDNNRDEFERLKSIEFEKSFKGCEQDLTLFISRIDKEKFDKDLDKLIKSSDFVFDRGMVDLLKCSEQFLLSSLEKDFYFTIKNIEAILYRVRFSKMHIDLDVIKDIIKKNVDDILGFKNFIISNDFFMNFWLDTSEKIFEYSLENDSKTTLLHLSSCNSKNKEKVSPIIDNYVREHLDKYKDFVLKEDNGYLLEFSSELLKISLRNNFEKTVKELKYIDNSIKDKASVVIDNYVREHLDKYKNFVLKEDNRYLLEFSSELVKISLRNNFKKTVKELEYIDNSIKDKVSVVIDNYVREHLDKYKNFVLKEDNSCLAEFSSELVKISLRNNFEKTMNELAKMSESRLKISRKVIKEEMSKDSQKFYEYFDSRMKVLNEGIEWCKEAFILSDDYLCDFVKDIPSFVTYILKSTFPDYSLEVFSERLKYNGIYFKKYDEIGKTDVMSQELCNKIVQCFEKDFNRTIIHISEKCHNKFIINRKDEDVLINELKKHNYMFDDNGYKFMKIFSYTKVFDCIKKNMVKNERDCLYCDVVEAVDKCFINSEPLIQILKSQDIDSIVYTSEVIRNDIIDGLWFELPNLIHEIGVNKISKLIENQPIGSLPDRVIGYRAFLNGLLKNDYDEEQISILCDVINNSEYSPELETKFLQLVNGEYSNISEYISSFAFNGLLIKNMTIEQRAAFKLYCQKKMMKEMGRGVDITFVLENFSGSLGKYRSKHDSISVILDKDRENYSAEVLLSAMLHECNHAVQAYNIKNNNIDEDLDILVYSKDELIRDILGDDYYENNYENISYEFDAQFKAEIELSKMKGISIEEMFNEAVDEINEAYEENKKLILKTLEDGYTNKMVRVHEGVEYGQETLFLLKLKEYLESAEDEKIKEIGDNYPIIPLGYDLSSGEARSLKDMLDIINSESDEKIKGCCWFIIKERFDKNRYVKGEEYLMYSDLELLEKYKFSNEENHVLALSLKEAIEKNRMSNVMSKMHSNRRVGR